MKEVCGYLVIENKSDFENHIWEDKISCRIDSGVVHHNGDNNFPQYYEYQESWDNHFCGDWIKCPKEKVIQAIDDRIEYFKNIKKTIE